MRITMVMASAEDGGLEKHVIELSNGLSLDHQVSLIAHSRYRDQVDSKVNFIEMDLSGSRYNPFTKMRLKQKILQSQPDVLHAHASKTAKLLQNMLKNFNFPSVVTMHGLKSNINAYLAFDQIIVVSQRLADEINLPKKVTVIHNGVTLTEQAKPWLRNRKFIAIGRLNEVKGFDVLIEAWKDISHELLIVGDGEEKSKLQQLIDQYQLNDRVKLYGYSDHIHEQINQSEALIISSFREGGPYTLSEALLLKRPVIGTDVGVLPEFIPQQFICAPHDVPALNQLIHDYLSENNIEQKFEMAFSQAQEKLSFNKMIEHTLSLYQRLKS